MKLTLLLIILNVAIFLLSLTNLDYFLVNFGFSVNGFLAGKYYTIITNMFLHAGVVHIAGNMIALFVPIFGYSPDTIAIGASAAISGLVGLGIFVCPGKLVFFPAFIPLPFALAGAIYFLANFSNLFAPGYVAYSAHIFGFLAGSLFGFAWGENRVKRLIIFIALLALIVALPTILDFIFSQI